MRSSNLLSSRLVRSFNSSTEVAVIKAREVAEPGDVVLMAPAAASMDQFKNYAERGNVFVEAVQRVVGEGILTT